VLERPPLELGLLLSQPWVVRVVDRLADLDEGRAHPRFSCGGGASRPLGVLPGRCTPGTDGFFTSEPCGFGFGPPRSSSGAIIGSPL
jgi:hypothetical protein